MKSLSISAVIAIACVTGCAAPESVATNDLGVATGAVMEECRTVMSGELVADPGATLAGMGERGSFEATLWAGHDAVGAISARYLHTGQLHEGEIDGEFRIGDIGGAMWGEYLPAEDHRAVIKLRFVGDDGHESVGFAHAGYMDGDKSGSSYVDGFALCAVVIAREQGPERSN